MKILKKVIQSIIVFLLLISQTQMVSAAAVKVIFKSGAETDYYIVTDKHQHGKESNPLNYKNIQRIGEDHWERAFCIEPGVSLPEQEQELSGEVSSFTKLNRIAYLGYYRQANQKNYIFTQAMIYENLDGDKREVVQQIGTESGGDVTAEYQSWKAGIQKVLDRFTTKPSFDQSTLSYKAGQSYEVVDSKGTLEDYPSFTIQKDGVTLKHSASSNSMTITINDMKNEKNIEFDEKTIEDQGGYKFKSTANINLVFKNDNQDLLCAGSVEPIPFSIQIRVTPNLGDIQIAKQDDFGKYDQETGNRYVPQTSFQLSKKSDMSEVIGTYTTKDDGKVIINDIEEGQYYIQEIKVPDHLRLDQTIYPIQVVAGKVNTFQANNILKNGKLHIVKIGSDGSSGLVTGLAGVEFTMKLYQDVVQYGWDDAKTYAVLKTDQNGEATSTQVPLGQYLVRETKSPYDRIIAGDFFVNIDEDEEIEYRIVNNAPFQAWLKLIKTDGEKIVTLSHTSFKIKDENGNYLRQKVGMEYKDIFTTDERGYVVLDEMIEAGLYTIEEIQSPDGFLMGESLLVEINSTSPNISFDENEPVISVEFQDDKPVGRILVNKTFEKDTDQMTGEVKWKLTAYQDIVDPADGNILYHQGDTITIDYPDGIYTLVKGNQLVIENLPLGIKGASYQFEEIETLDGYALLEEPLIFHFEINDNTTKEYTIEKNVENHLTETYFSKTDINGKELEGGEYELRDALTQEVIDQWTSDGTPHIIHGLIINHDYILHENLAPIGYAFAQDITFTLEKNKQTITMVDELLLTHIVIRKIDSSSKQLILSKDFSFGLFSDQDCTHLLQDISSNTNEGTVTFHDLPFGTYYIKETKAPEGYQLSDEVITVVIDENLEGVGETYTFDFENTAIPIPVVKTGDYTSMLPYFFLSLASLIGLVFIFKKKLVK